MRLWLERETSIFEEPASVLHVAPEPCFINALGALPHIRYLSIDLESARAMRRMDLTDLDLPDNEFDAVICTHVLEHIPDDRAAMRELHRVTKPEGWALLLTPYHHDQPTTYEDPTVTTPEERLRVFGQADHVRNYGIDFFDRLRACGWTVECSDYAATLPEGARKRFGLAVVEEIIVGRKAMAK